jgi:hypothetical protein
MIILPRPIGSHALHIAPYVADHANNARLYRITGYHRFGGRQVNFWFERWFDATRFFEASIDGTLDPGHWRPVIQPFEPFEWPIDSYDFTFTVIDILTANPGVLQGFAVPLSFPVAVNLCEALAGGGGGGGGLVTGCVSSTAGAGGGGAYANVSDLALPPGTTVDYEIGVAGTAGLFNTSSGGNGGQSWFNGTTFAGASVAATPGAGGTHGVNAPGGGGGLASGCTGTVKNSGGTGGNGPATFTNGGGGGGAGGPNGAGGSSTGTQGQGGAGDAGFGGAGGTNAPTAGGNGTEFSNGAAGVGAGGGGGGGFGSNGLSGGNYGAGGGGAYLNTNGGPGTQGVILVSFTPWIYFQAIVSQ